MILASCLVAFAALIVLARATAIDWRTAPRESVGIAPLPRDTPEAIVQVYGARAINWRGWFSLHCWIAVKEAGADHYTVYQVAGWQLWRSGNAVMAQNDIPDRSWFGARPYVIDELRGAAAAAAIPQIRAAVASYAYAKTYHAWPGPNSNTFVAHIIRSVPGLRVELPANAIGKDWLNGGAFFARSESGTGWQFSFFGLLGLTIGKGEGIEFNLLGLNFGVDILHPALKLPIVGRIGMKDGPA
jgi:hypothetical protein